MTFASPAAAREGDSIFSQRQLTETGTGRHLWQFQAPVPLGATNDGDELTFRHQTSEKVRQLQADIKRVARFPFNILITG